jgi:hypothetical protein
MSVKLAPARELPWWMENQISIWLSQELRGEVQADVGMVGEPALALDREGSGGAAGLRPPTLREESSSAPELSACVFR